ncbi:hypothetical protein INN71_02745 [Nocardioides sp. ChNu-153]|uniref:hypothetical protein n=1 Tax=Nocardioides sp. ChNu-153 TaxID=2779364 RepID=UPI0026524524|nr:hypothetical protein [Nocardioides sp. ChNu-153]MDN7120304.1 hypothetical protein [Nocardioides sp. ChNu-153]
MPDNLVRVRHQGREFNYGRDAAELTGLEVLDDEPTRRRDGSPRPATRAANGRRAKPTTKLAPAKKAAAKEAVTSSANDTKEQDQ